MTRLLGTTVVCLAILGGGAAAAQAQTCTWTGSADSEWSNPVNWSSNLIPGAVNSIGCDVVLPAGAPHYPVDLGFYSEPDGGGTAHVMQSQIGGLSIAAGAGLVVHGQGYNINGDGGSQIELTMSGAGTIAAGGSLELLASDDGSQGGSGIGGFATLDGSGTLTNDGALVSQSTTTQVATLQNTLGVNVIDNAAATVQAGTLHANGEQSIVNNATWTTDPGATMQLEYNGFNQHGTATSFTNNASYVNNGQTIMAQHDTAQVGNSFANPITWSQLGGSVTGANAIQLSGGAELNDAAGAGTFLLNQVEEHLVGTIPAGQTVEVQGDPFNNNGQATENDNRVTLGGSEVINHGTLILDTPSGSTGTGPVLLGAPLDNEGTMNVVSEGTGGVSELDDGLTNGGALNVQSGELLMTNGATDANNGTLTIAPSGNVTVNANPFLTGSTTFVNHGTIAPQISSSAAAQMTLGKTVNVTLGGTVAPQLLGGYVPAVGTELQTFPLPGTAVTGTFAAVTGGFTADYGHEKDDQPYIGLVFNGLPATGTGPGGPAKPGSKPKRFSALILHKPSVKGSSVRLLLSCAKGKGCRRATVTATAHVRVKGRKGKTKTVAVVVAKAKASLKSGAHRTLSLTLNPAGRKLLTRAHRLKLTVTIAVGGKARKHYTVTVRAAKKHHKHHKRG